MNFTKNDLYIVIGIIGGLGIGKKWVSPIISGTLGA